MKCYIKRYNEKMNKYSYFAKNLGKNENHWVIFKEEAKEFNNIRNAKWFIKRYKLNKVEIEKCIK